VTRVRSRPGTPATRERSEPRNIERKETRTGKHNPEPYCHTVLSENKFVGKHSRLVGPAKQLFVLDNHTHGSVAVLTIRIRAQSASARERLTESASKALPLNIGPGHFQIGGYFRKT